MQQDLYFILHNGHESLPKVLKRLSDWSEDQIVSQSETFSLVSIVIAVSSLVAITVVVVPLVYPLLTHYERLA